MKAKMIATAAAMAVMALGSMACSTASPCPQECNPAPATAEEPELVEVENTSPEEVVEVAEEPVEPFVGSFDDSVARISPDDRVGVLALAEGRNAYVGQISLAPDTEVPLHRHESEEYLFILEGGGTMTIEGEQYELAAGSMVAVPSNAEHGFVNGPRRTVAFQVFAIPDAAHRFLEWEELEGTFPPGGED